ncbi:MFS-type transporter clz9 [Cladobotryum mycophilum]|uniref:MFS-type transporter clz9 n=1 Tax=Cladobotryum mycophilum TaxID=491253 RepID=A0ABR0SRC9_9HYPO
MSEESCGRAPSRKQIRSFAQLILDYSGRDEQLGHHWVDKFYERNSEVKIKVSRGVEAVRTISTTEEVIREFYGRLDDQIKAKSIGMTRIYNFDETGLTEGETRAGKVTIMECVSADGRRIKPYVIYTGKTVQQQWFADEIPDWAYDSSPTGWANTRILEKWLEQVFLPETTPEIQSLWRILILDNHTTHISLNFMYLAWINRVQLLYLPSHSSHITQLLDVGVFGPLKTYFRQNTQGFASFQTSAPVQKQRFLHIYFSAAEKAFTKMNIKSGFRAAGIYPTNVGRALEGVVWYTPQSSKEVREQLDLVRKDLDHANHGLRGLRTIARKAGKELDHKNSMIASLEHKNAFLEAQIASKKPLGRKAVDYNPNETFARIPDIAKAQDEAKKARDRNAARQTAKLQKTSLEIARKNTEELTNEFVL